MVTLFLEAGTYVINRLNPVILIRVHIQLLEYIGRLSNSEDFDARRIVGIDLGRRFVGHSFESEQL